jgi:hypothetical protein
VQVAPAEVTTLTDANLTKDDRTPEQDAEAKELSEVETAFESVNQTTESSDANMTLGEGGDESASPTSIISTDSAQMIIVVVGGIIIAEMVFIFVRCRRKTKERERQRSLLIPYSVDPKANPNLKYEKVGKDDVEGDLF